MAETDVIVDLDFEKDEDLKATESRIAELRKKMDRNAEEEKEFSELKKHHRGRLTEQLNEKEEARIREAERAARAEQALEDANRRLKEIEDRRTTTRTTNAQYETIEIGGQMYYTDEALNQMVADGKMSQGEAWKNQKALIKAEAKSEMQMAADVDAPKKIWLAKRKASLEYVKEQGFDYFLDTSHPKFNSNDPLYKEANRLWLNGYEHHPDGPRLALEDAKKNLGMTSKKPDLSEEFSVQRNNSATDSNATRSKTVELSEIEKDNAVRYYCIGNVVNPKTNKVYTHAEAILKAMDAKKRRLGQK